MLFEKLTIQDIRRETGDCISLSFAIPDALKEKYLFTPGQNITLRAVLNGEEIRRSYSICSTPQDQELRIAIKQVQTGRFSTHANQLLKPGDVLEVLPPSGRFFTKLHPEQQKNYAAFVAGSGITPVLSIIKTTLQTEPRSTFTLIYGNRNRNSIIFKEELEALKNKYMQRFRVLYILSRERTDAPINTGRIDAEKCNYLLSHIIDPLATDEFFICGPEVMILLVKETLEKKGVDKKKIHFELFTTPGQKTQSDRQNNTTNNDSSKVTVRVDGVAFAFDLPYHSNSILEAALLHGADLPYACKGGVCGTCRAKLVSGQVEMEVNYALEPEETAAGFILACQAHPRSTEILVDFDEK